ncbi:MAG: efflux RND transporter periplasmic adaptor subunit [Breznakibacter sp.]
MKTRLSNKYLIYSLLILAGIAIGRLIFHPSHPVATDTHDHPAHAEESTVWTCSMHPQIRMDEPGKCPLCGMDLIPLTSGSTTIDPAAIRLTPEAAALANVQTSVVSKQSPAKEVRLYGKIQADERLLQSQVAHIPGRIETLRVNFTGEPVRKGQVLASVYSPELVTARQELLEALKTKHLYPDFYEAAKEKLRQWKLTDAQISALESGGTATNVFDITANTSGVVTARRINVGDYVSAGTVLYDVADFSTLWAMFDAYESDLPFIRAGNRLEFTVQALPGKTFTGRIAFIDPVIDPVTRVAKVRVETANPSGQLKPEMFATGFVNAELKELGDRLVVPRSAVLWTGKRSIVYVKQPGSDEPVFKLREIELGPTLGNSYVVLGGLEEGEEIVTQGTFNVDAAAQLEGKPSMMNPVGGQAAAGHDHGQRPHDTLPGDVHDANTQQATFTASGNCDMCKERIERAARSVSGIKSAVWDGNTQKIHVTFTGHTQIEAVQQAITKAGHDTERFKAPDAAYDALPECCLYRE